MSAGNQYVMLCQKIDVKKNRSTVQEKLNYVYKVFVASNDDTCNTTYDNELKKFRA